MRVEKKKKKKDKRKIVENIIHTYKHTHYIYVCSHIYMYTYNLKVIMDITKPPCAIHFLN